MSVRESIYIEGFQHKSSAAHLPRRQHADVGCLCCPGLPDRERRFRPLKTPLLPQYQYRAIEDPPGGAVGQIVLVIDRRPGPVILHHRMPNFGPAKCRAIGGQRFVRQSAGILRHLP